MILSDLNYDIHITNNNHQLLREKLSAFDQVFVVTDQHVFQLHKGFFDQVFDFNKTVIHMIQPGETSKSLDVYQSICDDFLDHHIKRDDVIVAVGGGVVGDLAGFVASTLLRGVSFIQVPTTLLAMVDSSVGSKVGINTRQGKNLIGQFYDPLFVHIDITFLDTLTKREHNNGYAEIIKASLIGDPILFDQLKNPDHDLKDVIMRALKVKINIVKKDPFESKERMYLNFGHTLGHAIEKEMNYETIKHGEAISHGMMYAIRKGIEQQTTDTFLETEVENILNQYQLLNIKIGNIKTYENRMLSDKKQRKEGLQFVFIQSIGNPIIKTI
jgi:3-dehydroquinate synthase